MATDLLVDQQEQQERTGEVRASAACNDGSGALVELFFSEDVHDIARAKHLCANCEIRRSCLQGALERQEACGVWGGELFVAGRVVVHKRRRGRPPKYRAAEVMVIDGVDVVVAPEVHSA